LVSVYRPDAELPRSLRTGPASVTCIPAGVRWHTELPSVDVSAVDGGYRLVNRDGRAAELTGSGAGAGTPDGSAAQRLLLLTP
jgi:hypothetical protein